MRFYKVNLPDEDSKITVIKDKILELGKQLEAGQTIIYVRTRKSAAKLLKALVEHGYAVTRTQGQNRDKIVQEFNTGLARVLVSSDLYAMGFDKSKVNLVIHYDLPVMYDDDTEPDNELYLDHICGGQLFGGEGVVFNLLCGDTDYKIMGEIESHFNHNVIEVPSTSDEVFKDVLKEAGFI